MAVPATAAISTTAVRTAAAKVNFIACMTCLPVLDWEKATAGGGAPLFPAAQAGAQSRRYYSVRRLLMAAASVPSSR